MTCSDFGRSALGICAIAAMLSGCGASESPIAAPESDAAVRTISHRIEPASSSYQLLTASVAALTEPPRTRA